MTANQFSQLTAEEQKEYLKSLKDKNNGVKKTANIINNFVKMNKNDILKENKHD